MPEVRPDRRLGPGHDDFWGYCAKGELRVQRCQKCGAATWPAVEECEICHSPDLEWEKVSGRGKIVSWTAFERDYYNGMFPMPWTNILVELEEGPFILSEPKGFDYREAKVGTPVRVAFIPVRDSAGAFNLPVFERNLAGP